MNKYKRKYCTIVLHPFFFALFPITAIYSQDVQYIPFKSVLLVIIFSFGSVGLLFLLAKLILKDFHRAALLVSAAIVLFFSYSTVFSLLKELLRHRVLLTFNILIVLCTLIALWRTKRDLTPLTRWLNGVALIFVLVPTSFALASIFKEGFGSARIGTIESNFELRMDIKSSALPDIYFIVLDGYGGSDMLKTLYQFDNSLFTQRLETMGFYVVNQAKSNYTSTPQSIASILNMDYIENLFGHINKESRSFTPMLNAICQSRLLNVLSENYGYRFVSFATGYYYTECKDADYYLGPGVHLGEFANSVINLTAYPVLVEKLGSALSPYTLHRKRILFLLQQLPDISRDEHPTFTFAHIIAPHPPFVFDSKGHDTSPRDQPYGFWDDVKHMPGTTNEERIGAYRRAYVEQTKFINQLIIEAIGEIQRRSNPPPIIILLGDHGPFSLRGEQGFTRTWERFSILNAYSLPGPSSFLIPKDVTPVNTFRLVLREYFGANIELLDNRYFFSNYHRPYFGTRIEVPSEPPSFSLH